MKRKKGVVTNVLDKKVVIIVKNADGTLYTIEADFIKNVIDDWSGIKSFVPEDCARVLFASVNQVPISPYRYTDFESLIEPLAEILPYDVR